MSVMAALSVLRAPPPSPSTNGGCSSITGITTAATSSTGGGSILASSLQLASGWTNSTTTRAATPLQQGPTSMQGAPPGAPPGAPLQTHVFVPGIRCDATSRQTLQGAVPKELAAKFEQHKRDAGEAIAARKAAASAAAAASATQAPASHAGAAHAAEIQPQVQSSPRLARPIEAHQRPPSRPRHQLKRGSIILEDLDNKRLLDLQLQQRSADVDHRSLSPRRSLARGVDKLSKRRSADDTLLLQKNAANAGGRQMFDKRTLRRRHKEEFRAAIQEWRGGHTAPGGKPRRAQVCHVSVRMRPMFEKEQQQGEFDVVTVVEEWGEVVVHNCLFHADLVRMFVHHSGFCFPRAFGAAASNEDVYAECGWPLVSHALGGELGTLFMFGQTGSGKTYTMSAIMELAAQDIFAAIGDRDEVAVRLKAFEVAGKKCFDLLPRQRTELKLLHDQSGHTNIVGAVEAPVPSAEECLRLLREALARRATAGHARNDESSRSHCVCVLDLLAVGGSLILVDCAGTERRQDNEQHSHERMRESAEINSSLHALKECIRYRCKQQHAVQHAAKTGNDGHEEDERHHVHVPYRDSQLTRVLHESFTRPGSYLAAIGTIAPSSMDAEHSMSTLKTLQLLMSESGQSDAPNFEQRVDVDPKNSVLRRGIPPRDQPRPSPVRGGGRTSTKEGVSSEPLPPSKAVEKTPPAPSSINSARCVLTNRPLLFSQQRGEAKENDRGNEGGANVISVPDTPQPLSSRHVKSTEILGEKRAFFPSEPPELTAQADGRAESPRQSRQPKLQEAWRAEPPAEPQLPATLRTRRPAVEAGEGRGEAASSREESMQVEIARLQRHVQQLEDSLQKAQSPTDAPPQLCTPAELSELQSIAENALRRAEELEAKNQWLEALYRSEQEQRRRSHNQLLDLKGQIRVFCRLRPLLQREQGEDSVVVRRDGFTVEVTRPMTSVDLVQRSERKAFQFDAVFGPAAQQEEVYREVEDLVQSAVDGYNVTILAYGQTGAGKTFTMYGGQKEQRGIVGRTIESIFQLLQGLDQIRFAYTVRAHLVELYKNDLVDLLVPAAGVGGGRPSTPIVRETGGRLEVRRDAQTGDTSIDHVSERVVTDPDQLLRLVEEGAEHRHTAATQMNDCSSRSHLFFTISIDVTDRETKGTTTGKIRLCDLAGSERPKKSGSAGELMKEAIEINKALTALGDVIESLTRSPGRGPVPYRNHKLTQLLSDSIGGSAKTLMFVNLSPAKSEVEETLNSLAYASRARNIHNDVRPHMLASQARIIGRSASPTPAPLLRRRIAPQDAGKSSAEDPEEAARQTALPS